MRIGILGGTGFIGSAIADKMAAAGHSLQLLVRPGSESRAAGQGSRVLFTGDVTDAAALRSVFEGCDAAVYSIGILKEDRRRGITFEELHFRSVVRAVDAAKSSGAKRFLLVSALGVKPDGNDYQSTKFRAEEYLKNSGLEYIILRPSIVWGDPRGRDEFCTMLARELIRKPIPAPDFYLPGRVSPDALRFAPVCVSDVAEASLRTLERPGSVGKTYFLGGSASFSWKETVQIIARACGKKKWFVPVPLPLAAIGAGLLAPTGLLPVSPAMLSMLAEGSVTHDGGAAWFELGMIPREFNPGALSYLHV